MGYLREADLGAAYPPYVAIRSALGFVPAFFHAQSPLPRAVEIQTAFATALLFRQSTLARIFKEQILLAVAVAERNVYWATAHYQNLYLLGAQERLLEQIVADYRSADLSPADQALIDFAARLSTSESIAGAAMRELADLGWSEGQVLETVVLSAWGKFLCACATGLGVEPDFEPIPLPPPDIFSPRIPSDSGDAGPYLPAPHLNPAEFAPFGALAGEFGFVPSLFLGQTLRPDLLEAEIATICPLLAADDLLTRRQKHYILLAISAAGQNSYWVTLESSLLLRLGVPLETSDRIASNHPEAPISSPDIALLDFALHLATEPREFHAGRLDPLRQLGFSDTHILEAVLITSLTLFLNTLHAGIGSSPDFPARPLLRSSANKVYRSGLGPRPTEVSRFADPDMELVFRVQQGELEAFEELMTRHSRRVYRTLVGILGNQEDARDAMQDTFLKAFQHLSEFEGRSKFSTWIVSIASNTGLQLLRDRRRLQSLDDDPFESDEGFRPRELRAWTDDPEQLCAKAQTRELVESTVMRLPAKYRAVLVLRDIEQLPTDEAASALGLGIPAFKARLLRGRLMVREALSPQFALSAKGSAS